jgi:hypothetical protein
VAAQREYVDAVLAAVIDGRRASEQSTRPLARRARVARINAEETVARLLSEPKMRRIDVDRRQIPHVVLGLEKQRGRARDVITRPRCVGSRLAGHARVAHGVPDRLEPRAARACGRWWETEREYDDDVNSCHDPRSPMSETLGIAASVAWGARKPGHTAGEMANLTGDALDHQS